MAATTEGLTEREITISRVFDAPRALVFAAWTEEEHLKHWWGPDGFSVPSCTSDPRPGGRFELVMRGPDGADYPQSGEYVEVVPPERLVSKEVALGEGGVPILEAVTTVTFRELPDGRTQMDLHARGVALAPEASGALGGMEAGWRQSIQRLDDHLTGAEDRLIMLMRMFEAPREAVWAAFTTAESVAQWWGPAGFTLTTERMDVHEGGEWLFTMHGPDGTDYPNLIRFLELDPPRSLRMWHGAPEPNDDPNFVSVVMFEEFMGQTVLTMRQIYPTAEQRDANVEKYNAIEGANQTLDRLGEFLKL